MKKFIKSGLLCLASAAMLLTGCKEDNGIPKNDVLNNSSTRPNIESSDNSGNISEVEKVSALEMISGELNELKSGSSDISLVVKSDNDEIINTNFEFLFNDKSFSIPSLKLNMPDLQDSDKTTLIDYTDLISVDGVYYINMDKIFKAQGEETNPIGVTYLQMTTDDLIDSTDMTSDNPSDITVDEILENIDQKALEKSFNNIINATNDFLGDYFNSLITDDGLTFKFNITEKDILNAKDLIISAIDDGSFQKYFEDIYDDLKDIENIFKDIDGIEFSIDDIDNIDYDELKNQLQELNSDTIPKFSIGFTASKTGENKYDFEILCDFEISNDMMNTDEYDTYADNSMSEKNNINIVMKISLESDSDIVITAPDRSDYITMDEFNEQFNVEYDYDGDYDNWDWDDDSDYNGWDIDYDDTTGQFTAEIN